MDNMISLYYGNLVSDQQEHRKEKTRRLCHKGVELMESPHDVVTTHRPLSSSLLGLPSLILNINHKKELLGGLWVDS